MVGRIRHTTLSLLQLGLGGSNHGTPINEILSNWTKKGKVKFKKDSNNKVEVVEIDNAEDHSEGK